MELVVTERIAGIDLTYEKYIIMKAYQLFQIKINYSLMICQMTTLYPYPKI